MHSTSDIGRMVLNFYRDLPFNCGDVDDAVRIVTQSDPLRDYTPLTVLLDSSTSVLEVGCGGGWLSNAIAYQYKSNVTAIDFNPVAIKHGQQVAERLRLDTRYEVRDLFQYIPSQPFDIVVSLGVLHHTHDCHEAFRHICRNMVRPGGHVFIGLYHKQGRKPFLDYFKELKRRGADEVSLFNEYKRLHKNIKDEVRLRSWLRDQVLHPHETQHTQREFAEIIAEESMTLVSSSINGFQPFASLEDIFSLENGYEERATQYLKQGIYFPGFFVFLAQRKA
ncbi:MAG: class I SAM-dependent methyltransferase [Humidesulfovibrio sp.]